jgi:hypothetical protein
MMPPYVPPDVPGYPATGYHGAGYPGAGYMPPGGTPYTGEYGYSSGMGEYPEGYTGNAQDRSAPRKP